MTTDYKRKQSSDKDGKKSNLNASNRRDNEKHVDKTEAAERELMGKSSCFNSQWLAMHLVVQSDFLFERDRADFLSSQGQLPLWLCVTCLLEYPSAFRNTPQEKFGIYHPKSARL